MRTAIVWEASPHHHKILVEGAPLQTMDRYRQDRSDKTEAGGFYWDIGKVHTFTSSKLQFRS